MLPQLRLLGVGRIEIDGQIMPISWQRRSFSLLTYVYTARGPVARDTAAAALWPDDDEETARGNLRRNLNLLRAALPPVIAGWITVDPGSIGFDRSAARTDAATFEALASSPQTHAQAVTMYDGDFALPLYDPWVLAERERLRARFHALLSELIGTQFSARRFDEALVFARRILADEPFREDILRRVMAIRYAAGDRPGALAEFERFRRELEREMNVEPMAETRALRDLVLRGQPLPSAPDADFRISTGSAAPVSLLPFGGREAQLQSLAAAWEAAAAGNGSTVFIAGTAGIGKTRIVAEFLERTVGSGARVLRGTTASPEARPFEVVLAALAQAAPFLTSMDIEPVWLGVLAPLVPEFGAAARDASPAMLPPERDMLRMFEAVARLFIAVARARPVVVILEDLHWAGPATLAAIRHAAKRLYGHRMLVVATFRDGEGASVETLRRELCGSGGASSIVLPPLSAAEAHAVISQLPDPPEARTAALIVERSEGNPLFLNELVREHPRAGGSAVAAIGQLVAARLEHASPSAQTAARVAAICGSTFDLDLLRAVLGWTDGALIDAIAELLERQFIRATATHERGSYAFTHALVREAVDANAGPDERRRTHYILARSLETRTSDATYAAEIARHWQAANENERAARAYATAARASLRAQARDEAADLATTGESLTAQAPLRFELVRIRLEAQLRHAPSHAMRADAAVLAALAAEIGEPAGYAAALLANEIEEVSGDAESRARSIDALLRFDDGGGEPSRPAEIASAWARYALFVNDIPAALSAAERARDRYRALGDVTEELRTAILASRIHGHVGNGPAADALLTTLESRVAAAADAHLTLEYWYARTASAHARYAGEALLDAAQHLHRAALDAGDRMLEGHAAWSSSVAHSICGRLTHAFRDTHRATEIYASLDAIGHLTSIKNNLASFLLQTGRVAEATRLLQENLRYAQDNALIGNEYFAASNLGVARLIAGDACEAREMQRRALELAQKIGSDAYIALARGDLGAAQAAAGAVAEGVANLREAAAMNAALNRQATRAHDLARAACWDFDPRSAASDARVALAIVDADIDAPKNAAEILWYCARTFERTGDAAAAAYARGRGQALLERRAPLIEDDEDRRHYLALPYHAALLEAQAAAPLHR